MNTQARVKRHAVRNIGQKIEMIIKFVHLCEKGYARSIYQKILF